MKTFNYALNGKQIQLTIKRKKSYYSCIVDICINGEKIAEETEADICFWTNLPLKAFLRFKAQEKEKLYLCICDKEVEKRDGTNLMETIRENRKIADYLWENVQESDFYAPIYPFTTEHWQNIEE